MTRKNGLRGADAAPAKKGDEAPPTEGAPDLAAPTPPTAPMQPPSVQDQEMCEQIRVLAYRKWEEAGSPAGNGEEFWLEAEKEVKGSS